MPITNIMLSRGELVACRFRHFENYILVLADEGFSNLAIQFMFCGTVFTVHSPQTHSLRDHLLLAICLASSSNGIRIDVYSTRIRHCKDLTLQVYFKLCTCSRLIKLS